SPRPLPKNSRQLRQRSARQQSSLRKLQRTAHPTRPLPPFRNCEQILCPIRRKERCGEALRAAHLESCRLADPPPMVRWRRQQRWNNRRNSFPPAKTHVRSAVARAAASIPQPAALACVHVQRQTRKDLLSLGPPLFLVPQEQPCPYPLIYRTPSRQRLAEMIKPTQFASRFTKMRRCCEISFSSYDRHDLTLSLQLRLRGEQPRR